MKIVPLTREHLEQMKGDYEIPPQSVRGNAVINDEGIAIGCAGGYHVGGHVLAFLHATDELRESKYMLVRLAVSLRKLPHSTVFAICDESIPKAKEFLEHFGFVDRGDGSMMLEK